VLFFHKLKTNLNKLMTVINVIESICEISDRAVSLGRALVYVLCGSFFVLLSVSCVKKEKEKLVDDGNVRMLVVRRVSTVPLHQSAKRNKGEDNGCFKIIEEKEIIGKIVNGINYHSKHEAIDLFPGCQVEIVYSDARPIKKIRINCSGTLVKNDGAVYRLGSETATLLRLDCNSP
jgi:hypothetical protein